MKNVRMISRGILGFISSVLLVLLTLLLVFKSTLLNKNYVLELLEENDYYEKITEEVMEDMQNHMLSSGLDKKVLEEIYSEVDVKDDVKNLIGSIYSGSKHSVDTSKIKEKLDANIDNYLKENNIEAEDEKALEEFKTNIINIYKNEVNLYGYFDNLGSMYVTINDYSNIVIVISIVVITVNVLFIRYLHKKYLGVVLLSGGLGIMYLKMFIWEGIDVKNIIIISESFSNILKKMLTGIGNNMINYALIFIIAGIVLNVISSFKKVKRVKRT